MALKFLRADFSAFSIAWYLRFGPPPTKAIPIPAVAAQHIINAPNPSLIKGADYLTWRYLRHPTRPYRLWVVEESRHGASVGWLVTGTQNASHWVIDAGLPPSLTRPQAWSTVLQHLGAASGQLQWFSWRAAHGSGHRCTPSLIVPGEFRIINLLGQVESAPDSGPPQPDFQPGDTDVF
jgi:hypothetical protein